MTLRNLSVGIVVYFLLINLAWATPYAKLEPLPQHRDSTILITKIIEQNHYKASSLDDELSEEVFQAYLDALDPSKIFFTQKDIDQFKKYRHLLDDSLLRGDLTAAFEIFKQFNAQRVKRANYAISLLKKPFDFSVKENYLFDREDLPWASDEDELKEVWRKRVKNDYLTMVLQDKKDKEIKKTLKKRYQRLINRSDQFKSEDAYEIFINAYLRTIEPHTAYFSPRTSENFNINMSLSLEGIGAVLQTEEDYTVVKRVIKGGPADLAGQLHEGDKIIGVGQGTKEVEDVIGWRLDDVVQQIRGPKGSVVQLHILPRDSEPGSSGEYISIVRNKIKLEEQQVQKSIIDVPNGDSTKKIGVIEVPTFYMDFDALARGEEDFTSTTRDTEQIIKELKDENVEGIIVDLRGNGGGSLTEAISFTGLFIDHGPVVQIRGSNGDVKIESDEDSGTVYRGPLIVLVDRFSASASEIFAGAIQDYDRGIIVGEPTYGKGTVQTIIDLNRFIKNDDWNLGKLKLTMAQFFRVNGDSTQHRGVVPDIIFPTSVAHEDQGERGLENALPWANIEAAEFKPFRGILYDTKQAKMRHENRVKKDIGFNLLLSQAERRQEILDRKIISLLEKERKNDQAKQEQDQNAKLNEFRLSRGMKEVSVNEEFSDEEDDSSDSKRELLNEEIQKILLREAATILVDLSNVTPERKVTQQKNPVTSSSQL